MITLIGSSLDSANKKVLDKMNKLDFDFIKREAISQLESGAEFIELNAISLLDNEVYFLKKAVPLIEGLGGKALIRCADIENIMDVVNVAKNELIIGNIEYNKKKIDLIINIVKNENIKIIAQIKGKKDRDEIYPEKSLYIAQMFIDYLLDHGISRSDILLDPVVRPLEDDFCNGKTFLNTLELFKLDFPQIRTIANLSALSMGLPKRNLITAYFLSLAIEKGLDYLVLNVLDKSISESLISTLSIIGKDRNLHSYLNYCRHNKNSKVLED